MWYSVCYSGRDILIFSSTGVGGVGAGGGADAESSSSDVDVMDALRPRVAADTGVGVGACGRVGPAPRGAASLLSEFCIRNVGDQPTDGIIQHGRSDLHMYSNIAKEALDPHIPKKSLTEGDVSAVGASSNLLSKALYAHLLEDGQRLGISEAARITNYNIPISPLNAPRWVG